ncbi:phosphonate transport system permease protein [Mycoplasma testudineum]|uniref:Phosphonate transport system permease protein n=1 Tax=Mycoplasma testudineum TaxID=244584 RepID=A0A4R6IC98_9MOLU|nr:hypothetical protein [Mycoplasma testudineum]OYD26734.1 hypothetical protein CG473_02150 [Mycoplasma testudineum]TDO19870.1 phosphonate transport system permease protein [Mycoplasma testudineum]
MKSKLIYWEAKIRGKKVKIINPNFYIILLIFISIIAIVFLALNSSMFNNLGTELTREYLNKMFVFKSSSQSFDTENLWTLSLIYLWSTIKIVTLGTTIGFLLALLTSFFGSKKIFNNVFSIVFRIFILFLRALPIIYMINLFRTGFVGNDSAFLIFAWFTWLWVHRYLIDYINSLDFKYFDQARKLNKNIFSLYYREIFLRLKTKIISLYFYSFESNIRWVSLLSAVGVIGIGTLFYIPLSQPFVIDISEATIPLFVYVIFLLIFEAFNFCLINLIFKSRSIILNNKKNLILKYWWKKIVIFCLLLTTAFISIATLFDLEYNYATTHVMINMIQRLFQIDLAKVFASNSTSPIVSLLSVIGQAFSITFFVFIIGLIIGILSNSKINSKTTSIIWKLLSVFIRSIPFIVLFYVLNPLWIRPHSTLFIVLIFQGSFTFSRKVSEAIDKIDLIIYNNLKRNGFSKIKIFWLYIYPLIRKELMYQNALEFESQIRSLIFLGVFGINHLGQIINSFSERQTYSELANYIWPTAAFIILLEIVTYQIFEKNKVNIFIRYKEKLIALYKTKFTKKII